MFDAVITDPDFGESMCNVATIFALNLSVIELKRADIEHHLSQPLVNPDHPGMKKRSRRNKPS